MATVADTIDLALREVDLLRKLLKKKSTAQVWSAEERSIIKANALAWFQVHKNACAILSGSASLMAAESYYRQLLEGSDRATGRATYERVLRALRPNLIALRSEAMVQSNPAVTTNEAPTFMPLIADPSMQKILVGRWRECVACIGCEAPLAATVMMGGLLEALLLARIHREADQTCVFTSTKAPKDKTGRTKPLQEWGLKNYIDVAHDLGWITVSAKNVGDVLRDYRNYVHPHKQQSHNVYLNTDDAQLFWEISKAISLQVLKSAAD